jgi:hypothetical protein
MQHGLPMLACFSAWCWLRRRSKPTVSAPDNQRTLIAGFDSRVSCHTFKQLFAA